MAKRVALKGGQPSWFVTWIHFTHINKQTVLADKQKKQYPVTILSVINWKMPDRGVISKNYHYKGSQGNKFRLRVMGGHHILKLPCIKPHQPEKSASKHVTCWFFCFCARFQRSAAEGLLASFDAVHACILPRDGSWADVPPQYIQYTSLFFCGPPFFHHQAWEDEIMTDGYTFWTTI